MLRLRPGSGKGEKAEIASEIDQPFHGPKEIRVQGRVGALRQPDAAQRLSQKFFYVMGGAKAKVNPVGRTRLRTAAKANSFCHHRAS
jgi:hypothetical protein